MCARLFLLFCLIFCQAISQPLWAEHRVFQVEEGLDQQKLGPYAEYFKDQSKNLSLEGVKKTRDRHWKPLSTEVFSLGYLDSPVWVRVRLKNTGKIPLHLFLQESYPVLDQVLFFIPGEGGGYQQWKLGGTVSFADRFIPHKSFVVPISLAPQSQVTVYLRVWTEGRTIFSPGLYSRAGLLRQFLEEDPVLWLYLGFLLIMCFYNLLLYSAIREPAYLYYILFVLLLAMSRVLVNGLGYLIYLPGLTPITRVVGIICILAAAAAMIQFFRAYIGIKTYSPFMDRMAGLLVLVFVGVGLGYFLVSSAFYRKLTLYLILFTSLFLVVMCVYLMLKKSREAVFTTVAFSFFLGGTLILSMKSLGLLPSNTLTMNSVRIGSAVQIVLLSLALADKINLSRASTRKSEAGYRHLMLNSRNIVFTLNDEFCLQTINPVVEEYLGLQESELIGTNFVDLIAPDALFASMEPRKFFQDRLSEQVRSDSGERLRVYIRSKVSLEPQQMRLRLEYIQGEEERLMLGELSPVTEDILKQSVLEEEQSYLIDNSINNVEILSHRLTSILPRFLQADDVFALRMCLREALVNAIEHGNLELVYNDKSKALENNKYFEVLTGLRQDPRFAHRKVQVDYQLSSDQVSFRISDEGPGFNHKNILDEMELRARQEMNPNGRGLLMISSEFDKIEFNEKGNSIHLVRFFKREEDLVAGI